MGNLVFQATLGGQVNLVGPNTASTYNINVPTVSGDMVTTGDTGTVTNTMLAGSIANAKLVNSSFTLGSTAVSLGETKTTVAGLTLTNPTINGYTGDTSVVNIGSGQFYKDTSGNVGLGTTSPAKKLHINGDLMIANGTSSTAYFSDDYYKYITVAPSTGDYLAICQNPFASGIQLGFGTSGAPATFVPKVTITSGGTLQFDSGYGSVATAYGCRAWVNFNGTGTPAIRASGNVSSITDNGTGDYTLNFSTSLTDANYSPVLGYGQSAASNGYKCCVKLSTSETGAPILMSTSQLRIMTGGSNSSLDFANIYASILR